MEKEIMLKKKSKEIINPIKYLNEKLCNKDDTYTVSVKQIPNVSNSICRDFCDKNNCTLVALNNIANYYASNMQNATNVMNIKDAINMQNATSSSCNISTDVKERYKQIRDIAVRVGYDGEHGIFVLKNRRFANIFCKDILKGIKAKGRTHYFISYKRAIKSIDEGRPFLLSIASGYYFNHTVAVYGYANYINNRTGKCYTFLMLRDGWHNACRYLAWQNTGARYITCMTEIVITQQIIDLNVSDEG